MPRYIDADALVRRLKHSPLFLGTNMQFKDGVVDLVERQPTADVVPRSEVAREIIEELEERIAIHCFTSKSEDYADGMYDAVAWVDSKLAELKKKYTEVEK